MCIKKIIIGFICLLSIQAYAAKKGGADYMILVSNRVMRDSNWKIVVRTLHKLHPRAVQCTYENNPEDALGELRKYQPRYVAIVEKPEAIGRDYVMKVNRMSREVDSDIFADFLWGIITGYEAGAALRMVQNSKTPLVIKDALGTITELKSAKWFDKYAWIDDRVPGLVGEKKGKNEKVQTREVDKTDVLKTFTDLYRTYAPDLIVTASHATENNLEMPFSLGNIMASNGKLYACTLTNTTWNLAENTKRMVYLPIGNCLIGNVNNTSHSMAVAWMNGGNATAMVGYVVTTWHGRNGWGALKYWLTTPGRYTLAQAVFLNQQDFLYQQNRWYPSLLKTPYPFDAPDTSQAPENVLAKVLGKTPTLDQLGFWHDRDVLAYYGDPAWNVRLQNIPEETDFHVTSKIKDNVCTVTIKTDSNFNLKRMQGDDFKKEHVLDLPFSYFFPQRLKNARLVPGQNWNVAVSKDFLLIYNPDFKPSSIYQVKIAFDK